MTVVLDSGAVSRLAVSRDLVVLVGRRGGWPPVVPVVVLAECLTGIPRRDVLTNRFLRTCLIRPVDEAVVREAARLRTATGRAGTISAVDAIVAALAAELPDPIVLTSDPDDLAALVAHTARPVRVAGV